MSRTETLVNRVVEQLGVSPEDMTARFVGARAAPVAAVDRGHLHGHRFTDVGPNGFGLYEIVDDQRGSFVNVPVRHQATAEES